MDVLVPMGVELRESKALLALELPPPVVHEGEEEGVEEAVDQAPAEDEHGAELDHTAYDGAAAGREWASGRQALGALGAGCGVDEQGGSRITYCLWLWLLWALGRGSRNPALHSRLGVGWGADCR